MDAKKLVKGKKYEYVRKDGSVHILEYAYPTINSYVFKMPHCNTRHFMTRSMVEERIREHENK